MENIPFHLMTTKMCTCTQNGKLSIYIFTCRNMFIWSQLNYASQIKFCISYKFVCILVIGGKNLKLLFEALKVTYIKRLFWPPKEAEKRKLLFTNSSY